MENPGQQSSDKSFLDGRMFYAFSLKCFVILMCIAYALRMYYVFNLARVICIPDAVSWHFFLFRMRRMGLSTYLYAPKDDYKHRLHWRQKYTQSEEGITLTNIKHNIMLMTFDIMYVIASGQCFRQIKVGSFTL